MTKTLDQRLFDARVYSIDFPAEGRVQLFLYAKPKGMEDVIEGKTIEEALQVIERARAAWMKL
jgi:hypothetical protein